MEPPDTPTMSAARVPVWHCPVCGEKFLSREAIDAHRKEMNHGPDQTLAPEGGPSLLETARRIVAFADEAGMADECWRWNLGVLRRLVAAPHLSLWPKWCEEGDHPYFAISNGPTDYKCIVCHLTEENDRAETRIETLEVALRDHHLNAISEDQAYQGSEMYERTVAALAAPSGVKP